MKKRKTMIPTNKYLKNYFLHYIEIIYKYLYYLYYYYFNIIKKNINIQYKNIYKNIDITDFVKNYGEFFRQKL